jgi:signal transduction histidine kinase
MARTLFWNHLSPLTLSLPLALLLLGLGIRYGLAPLRRIAKEIGARDHRRLDPVSLGVIPQEIRPLIDAMNSLFQRLQDTFMRQSRFAADCAHELRAPLAGIKTQLQVADRADDPAQRAWALDQAAKAADRAIRTIEQLLVLARYDPETPDLPKASVDLNAIVVPLLTELAPAAIDKGVEVELQQEPGVFVWGNGEALGILIRNLVDNAVRYTPAGGRMNVTTRRAAAAACLMVEDTGPGIPEAMRERVFERFCRLMPEVGGGAGLGLSIAHRIAQAHDASIVLDTAAGGSGLAVQVMFPAAPAPAPSQAPRS